MVYLANHDLKCIGLNAFEVTCRFYAYSEKTLRVHSTRKTQRQIDVKIYDEVLACCDFTFDGTSERNPNKLTLRDSCLSINLTFSEVYLSVNLVYFCPRARAETRLR